MKVSFKGIAANKTGWLEARLNHINSTNAYDIISENGSAVRAFLDILGISDELKENNAMYWGKRLQQTVAEEFCTQYIVDHPGADVNLYHCDEMYVHDKFEWAQCSPDCIVGIDGLPYVLECKTASHYIAEDWITELPERPELQTLHQLAVMDEMHGAFVACLIHTPEFIYYPIYKEEAVLAGMLGQEYMFWRDHIEPKKAPAPNEDDGSYLNKLYQESNKEIIELPLDAYRLIEEYVEGGDAEKAGKKLKTTAYNQLKNLVAKADAGTIGQYTVAWTHKRSRLSIKETKVTEE